MATKRFITPFAEAGDRAEISDLPVGTDVNFQTGYPAEYEADPVTDPAARFVERDKTNQLFNDITGNIKHWQENTYPEFITEANNGGSAFTYKKGDIVSYNGVNYESLENSNEDIPTSSKWFPLSDALLNSEIDAAIWGDNYVGTFLNGFIYKSSQNVARDNDGKYYKYIGNDNYPVEVTSGTIASQNPGLFQEVKRSLRNKIYIDDFISGTPGGQNDAPAFQSAVNAANEGDEIIFTSQEYLLNSQTECLKDNIKFNFGKSVIKNTVQIPLQLENGQGINPILFIKANDCSVEGGYWEDIKSQGVYAGGVFNAVTPYVTTYSGFRARRMISNNLDNGELDNKFVQTRHISDVDIDTVWSFNHGNARLDKYAQSVSINYGTAASLTNCRVEGAESGGAFNMLYVDKGVFTDNVAFNVTNPLSPIACVAAHIKYSLNMTVANNSLHTLGGEAMKISEGVANINVTGNTLITEGENEDCYCVLQLQGVQGFNVSANTIITDGVRAIYATVHVTESTKRGTINNNFILRNPDSTNPASQGSGIWVVASTQDRDTISIHGNHLYNLDIFANQLESSFIDDNKFYVDRELFVFEYNSESVSSCINLNNCTGSSASNNSVINKVTTPIYPQVAVRATGAALSDINRNNVVYSAGAIKSYVVHDDTSSSCRFRGNTGSNAIDYSYKIGSAAAEHNYKWTYQKSTDVGTLTSMLSEQYEFAIPAIQIGAGNTFLTTKVSMPEALNGVIYSATFTGASTLSLTLFNPTASNIVPGNRVYYFTVERNTVN